MLGRPQLSERRGGHPPCVERRDRHLEGNRSDRGPGLEHPDQRAAHQPKLFAEPGKRIQLGQ